MDAMFVFVILAMAHSEMKDNEIKYIEPVGQNVVQSKNNVEWVIMSGSEIIMIKTDNN